MTGELNTATIIALIALAAILFFAIRYIIKEKKKGTKCIGCPYAGSCTKYQDEEFWKKENCLH